MTDVIVDAALRARLNNLDGLLRICDESGRVLGYFHPAEPVESEGGKVRSPFTDQELGARRQQRTGHPLAETLDRLATS